MKMRTFDTKNSVKVLGVYMLLILFYVNAFTQDKYFVKNYSWLHTHEGFDIKQVGDNYIIAGTAIDSPYVDWKAYNIVINEMGNVRKTSFNENSEGTEVFYELYCENDVCYSIGAKVKQNFTGFNRSFGMINSLTNFDYKIVDIGEDADSSGLFTIVKSNGKLFGGGGIDLADGVYEHYLYIVELDESLNVLNEFTYEVEEDFTSNITRMIPAPDGGLYVAAEINFSFSASDSYMKFLHIDSLGNIVTEQNINLTIEPERVTGLVLLNDGNLLVNLETMYYADLEGDATMLTMNPEGEILNSFVFENHYIEKVLPFDDGGFLTVSTYGDNTTDAKGNIQRLDSAGNILWERIYDGPLHQYFHSAIFQNGDDSGKSGYVVCGRNDTLSGPEELWAPASMWLLKLNCLGYPNDPKIDFDYSIVENTVYFQNKSQYLYLDEPIDGGTLSIDLGNGVVYDFTEESDSFFTYEYENAGFYNITFTGMVCNDTVVYNETICVNVEMPELNVDFDYEVIDQGSYKEVICTRSAADIDEFNGIYSWDFGGGTIIETNDSIVSHNYYEGDSISVKLESSLICNESFSKTKVISLLCETLDLETINLDFMIETFYYGDSTLTVFTNTSTYPDDLLNDFTWNFGDGNSLITDSEVVEHIYYTTDSLAASLFSEEICGNVFIHIEGFSIETSVAPIAYQSFTIFPNPTQDYVQLMLAEAGRSEIVIFDVYGKMVYSSFFDNQSFKIDVSTFSEGIYFVKGTLNDQLLETQKIVVVKSKE